MKNLKPKLYILIFILSVSSINSYAQSLSSGLDKGQLINYSENLKLKLQLIPNNELQIYEELKWVNSESSKLIGYKKKFEDDDFLSSIEALKTSIKNYWYLVNDFDCNSDNYNKLYDDIYIILTQIDDIAFNYDVDESSDYLKLMTIFRPIVRSAENSYTKKDCNDLKSKLTSNSEIKELIDKSISAVITKHEEKLAEHDEKQAQYDIIEKDLISYRDELIERQKKIRTKENLGSNLYLMILIIGGLSVLAIGLVRLFPERVMLEWVVSGQVIQFVTIMILLSAIMALGLSGLVKENTLGTLLGGIAGYVLSQGVGLSRNRNNDRTDHNNV